METEEKSEQEKEEIFQIVGMVGGKIDGLGNMSTYSSTDFCFGKQKTAIDSNILTAAILTEDLYNFLSQESKGAKIFITEKNRTETIGNLRNKGFSEEDANKKVELAKSDLNLEVLPFYPECQADATKIFEEATKQFKIKKIETFLQDCIILAILSKNGVFNYYSNDEELEKVCEKILPKIRVKQIKTKEEVKRRELREIDKLFSNAGIFRGKYNKKRFKKNRAKR